MPFIPDSLAIEFSDSDQKNVANISAKLLEASCISDWKALSEASKNIARTYSEARWMSEVRAFLPENSQKILLVSDYSSLL